MKKRPTAFHRLLRKFFPKKEKEGPVSLKAPEQKQKTPRSHIESLEGRIAPATLINAQTVSWVDLEGDTVTLKLSKPIFNEASHGPPSLLDDMFEFTDGTGPVAFGTDNSVHQQLQLLDFTRVPTALNGLLNGLSISVTAEKTNGQGDGLADVGAINALGLALGNVVIDGDLGQIDCGTEFRAPFHPIALQSLSVHSMFAKGFSTQKAGTSPAEIAEKLESQIFGKIQNLHVDGDFAGYLHIQNAVSFSGINIVVRAPGSIGHATIGGAIKGDVVTNQNAGLIDAELDIGSIEVGTQLTDGIVGGAGAKSGRIIAGRNLGVVTVMGSVHGSDGDSSGEIVGGTIGLVTVHGGSGGGLIGGKGPASGVIHSSNATGTVVVHGNVISGEGASSGVISSIHGMRSVTIDGSVIGRLIDPTDSTKELTTGLNSGGIFAQGNIQHVIVGGKLIGGKGESSGVISSQGTVGAIQIGSGSSDGVFGGAGKSSGGIDVTKKLGKVTIAGNIIGGSGEESGEISAAGLGLVTIQPGTNGGILGGGGVKSGRIVSNASVGRIDLHGNLNSGVGVDSGEISVSGNIGTLLIGGDIKGNVDFGDPTISVGSNSGRVTATGSVGTLVLQGKLLGGASEGTGTIASTLGIGTLSIGTVGNDGIFGGAGKNSGAISAVGKLSKVTINGNIIGAAGEGSGSMQSGGIAQMVVHADRFGGGVVGGGGLNSGSIRTTTAIGQIHIEGNIISGTGKQSGIISSEGTIQSILVDGDIRGLPTASYPANVADNNVGRSGGISAGKTINRLTIAGSVIGGSKNLTGFIEGQENINSMRVLGNVTGGAGANSGTISADGELRIVVIHSDLAGGGGQNSGSVMSGLDATLGRGDLGFVSVGGAMIGAGGFASGSISSGGMMHAVLVHGPSNGSAMRGGSGDLSGSIFSGKSIGAIKSLNSLVGGAGASSGSIIANGRIGVINVAGAVVGGGGELAGSILARDLISDSQEIAGSIGSVIISGQLEGAGGTNSGQIHADGSIGKVNVGSIVGSAQSGGVSTGLGMLASGDVGSFLVHHSATSLNGTVKILIGGRLGSFSTLDGDVTSTEIRVLNDIGSIHVAGDLKSSTISAVGQAVPSAHTDLAIAKVVAGGKVDHSNILAGYDLSGVPVNPDAQIGKVVVSGDWTASNLVAGVKDVNSDGFGNADDRKIPGADQVGIVSKIASVIIGGDIAGEGSDQFGFVAQQIGAFKHDGVALHLNGLPDGQVFELSATDHVSVREVPLT